MIRRSPNEILFSMRTCETLDLVKPDELAATENVDQILNCKHVRIQAEEALAFAAVESKRYYDRKHKAIFLDVGD